MICKMRQLDVQVSTSHYYKEDKIMYNNEKAMMSSEIAKDIAKVKTYLLKMYGSEWYKKFEVCVDSQGVYVKEL